MTTWPAGSKATTTSIDQGTVNPNLSRAQIKQDIDNINTITDTFNIPTTTPNGAILAYDDAAGEFNTTSAQSLVKAFLVYKDFETTLSDAQDDNGIYPTTTDGRRNNMLNRSLTFDPYGLITDITGDGFTLPEGTYLVKTQSTQTFYDTLGGSFGTQTGPSWLGHEIRNIEDDGDSTDNYPARWDNYSSFFNTTYSSPSQVYTLTGQKKYYLLYTGGGEAAYNFGASTLGGSPANTQQGKVVIEITKVGG